MARRAEERARATEKACDNTIRTMLQSIDDPKTLESICRALDIDGKSEQTVKKCASDKDPNTERLRTLAWFQAKKYYRSQFRAAKGESLSQDVSRSCWQRAFHPAFPPLGGSLAPPSPCEISVTVLLWPSGTERTLKQNEEDTSMGLDKGTERKENNEDTDMGLDKGDKGKDEASSNKGAGDSP